MPVTKNQFIKLLHHFSDNSAEDAKGILELKETYPYSQVLHALSARLSKDQGFAISQKELQLAAVYASDRLVLKEVMTRTTEAWPSSHEVDGQSHSETPQTISTPPKKAEVNTPVEEDLADEVIHDLEKLSELRHNFEMMFVDTDKAEIKKSEPVVEKQEETIKQEEPVKAEKKRPQPPGRKPGKSKAQRIIELARELEEKEENEDSNEPTDELIKEIKTTKKKITPENEKQKEQIEIIDNFIKAQPSISNAKDKVPAPQGDFSTIKSGDFNDNVISETLVALLIRQGKKEKAVEVLKKLIWKFPQKKAYFAAQIEELKK